MTSSVVHRLQKFLPRFLRGGIRYRLFVLVVLQFLPFVALSGFIIHQRYEMRRNSVLQSELEAAHSLAITFNTYLNGLRKQTLSVGYAISLLPPAEKAKANALLSRAVKSSPTLRNMSWLSPQGVVLISSAPALVGTDLSSRAHIAKVISGADLILGDLAPRGTITDRPTVTVATAIRDAHGTLRGMVLSAIEPARLHEVVLTQRRAAQGALALFDSRGTLVYHNIHTDPPWEERAGWLAGDQVLKSVLQDPRDRAGIQRLKALNNQKWVSARVPITGIGWVAGAGRPADVAFEEVRQGIISDALLGCAVFALAFLFAYLLGRSITVPLLNLENDARVMGEGRVVLRDDDPYAPTEVIALRETMQEMTRALLGRTDALRESESSLRTIFDNVYDGIAIHDDFGRIIEVNRRWLEMMRLGPEQVKGLTVIDVSAGAPSLEHLVPMWREVLRGEVKFFEWRVRRPADGSDFDAEIFLCSIRLRGRGLIMANVRDITERKRVAAELQKAREELEKRVEERTAELAAAFEELRGETEKRLAAVEEVRRKEQLLIQQSRLAALGEMMGKIAHHWRQPLNIIGLMIQDLSLSFQMQSLTDEEMVSQTDKVMSVLGRLSHSIDEFRNIFTPDATKSVFRIREVVEMGVSLLSTELNHIQVEVECEADELSVEGFRNEYLQVVLNLLNNAREALREREVADPRIEVRVFGESGRCVVTIADNAGGIDQGILERIFDPYFSTKGPEAGTGIGLFMAKMVIEKNMGGALTARNTGKGAEFRIEV